MDCLCFIAMEYRIRTANPGGQAYTRLLPCRALTHVENLVARQSNRQAKTACRRMSEATRITPEHTQPRLKNNGKVVSRGTTAPPRLSAQPEGVRGAGVPLSSDAWCQSRCADQRTQRFGSRTTAHDDHKPKRTCGNGALTMHGRPRAGQRRPGLSPLRRRLQALSRGSGTSSRRAASPGSSC